MTETQDLIKKIKIEMIKQDINQKDLSERIEMSDTTLNRYLNNNFPKNIETFIKLLNTLNLIK